MRLQYSLHSLCWFVAVASVVLALNCQTQVTNGGPIIVFGSGEYDVVRLERGWPLRYLVLERFVEPGTGAVVAERARTSNEGEIPSITRGHWLFADIVIGSIIAGLLALAGPRLIARGAALLRQRSARR